MNPSTPLSFRPFHNASVQIQNDRAALAHQLHLCRSDRSLWRRASALAEGTQAFAAQHLISVLTLVILIISSASWLVG